MRWQMSKAARPFALLALALLLHGCSLRTLAINKLGDALANPGDVFAADDDPELVGDALPFSLKLIESLLAESPEHRGLLLAAARGFTQYSYGWVEQGATELADSDPAASAFQMERARRLYLRARRYGLRGLGVAHRDFEQSLRSDRDATLRSLTRADVPLLYWTAAAWALGIAQSKDRPDEVADLPLVEAMIDRALQLDESYDSGAIHGFLISYEPNRAGAEGDGYARSRTHFDRSVELTKGQLASPFVALAEAVDVPQQNRKEFESLLGRALAIDVDAEPKWRVENKLAQRRASWLLQHADEMFLTDTGDSHE
jgi:predicted anti-sigma-YlaC factor YlaD